MDIKTMLFQPLKRGDVALEVEVEYDSPPDPQLETPEWGATRDDSLRNIGVEYVHRRPRKYGGLRWKKSLEDLDKHFKANRIRLVDTPRTSTHVHCNVQTKTMLELYKIITLYWLLEPLLFRLCGPYRRSNLFCLQLVDCEGLGQLVVDSLNTPTMPTNNWTTNNKYGALNLSSVNKFGSLEFRGMRGTHDVTEIDQWVRILLRIIEVASTPEFRDPAHMLDQYYELGQAEFLRKIFLEKEYDLLTKPGWDDLLNDGLESVLPIAYATDWQLWNKKHLAAEPEKNPPALEDMLR